LPTTRPHVLSDILPELCIEEPPVGPHIWELSHHCIDPAHPWGRRATRTIASALGAALVEWGLECGVTQFVFPIDVAGILPLVQLHFQPVPLGLPCKIRGRDMIAVMVALNELTLPCLRRLRGSQERVLAAAARPAFLHS
jgi:acyl-homoserine lactone synthase